MLSKEVSEEVEKFLLEMNEYAEANNRSVQGAILKTNLLILGMLFHELEYKKE